MQAAVPQSIEQTDEELFALVRENASEQAFRTLYRRYDKRLFAYCLRAMQARQAAEDVFQSVMTLVFEKRQSFSGGSFAAWLFTIARNQTLNHKQKQRITTDIDDVAYSMSDESDRTGEDVFLSDALKQAVSTLPEDYREALELKHFDGFAYEEIAQMLNISLSLAKVRVFRAKKMLQESLAPYLRELSATNSEEM
ncbi:MAG: RNA polymerase sigma factor [Candidatus Kapaibacterium sp.]|nr:MAG: RNA polymerase sigma factor [Candidatus Kapabacteria bacterium]